MEMPAFFDSAHARFDYDCNVGALVAEAMAYRARYNIALSAADKFTVEMLIVDMQRDFCFKQGGLFVGGRTGFGATEDVVRLARFIYTNLPRITSFTPTLDTHSALQIFFQSFWVDENDRPPSEGTIITAADVANRVFRPSPAAYHLAKGNTEWADAYVLHYCRQLEARGKYALMIWKWHCLLGTTGHALAGIIAEALFFHSFVRGVSMQPFLKGGNPWSEEYSALSAEVTTSHDGLKVASPLATNLVNRLLRRKALIIAGEASSHCVKSTIDDLLGEIIKRDPKLAKRVYILRDCMSPVVIAPHTDLDYTKQADDALQRYQDAGMNIVESTTPMSEWPGMPA